MNDREKLRNKFLSSHNINISDIELLPADASFRNYYRINNTDKLLMDAPPNKEKIDDYIKIAKFLSSCGFSTPKIYESDVKGFLLIEDFGDNSYRKILENNDSCKEELYSNLIDLLIKLHSVKAPDDILLYYNDEMFLNEANRIIEWYIPTVSNVKLNKKLIEEYQVIWRHLLQYTRYIPDTIVHKDYHVDNLIFINKGNSIKNVGIIDFQDAVIGSPIYDIVSLLEDARIEVSDTIVELMINRYLNARKDIAKKDFFACYAILGLHKNLRIIGNFARKSLRDNNQTYMKFIPRMWKYINNNLKHPLLLPFKMWLDKAIPIAIRK